MILVVQSLKFLLRKPTVLFPIAAAHFGVVQDKSSVKCYCHTKTCAGTRRIKNFAVHGVAGWNKQSYLVSCACWWRSS